MLGRIEGLQPAVDRYDTFYMTRLALANGLVYAGAGDLYVFHATGATNCSGSPKTCSPLRTVTIAGGITTPLAMASGMIYFSTGYLGSYHYDLYAVGLP